MRRGFLAGVGVGVVLMYFFDPSWGRRRRAQLRERLEVGARQVEAWRAQAERERLLEEDDADEAAEDGAARRDLREAEERDIDWLSATGRPGSVRRDE